MYLYSITLYISITNYRILMFVFCTDILFNYQYSVVLENFVQLPVFNCIEDFQIMAVVPITDATTVQQILPLSCVI